MLKGRAIKSEFEEFDEAFKPHMEDAFFVYASEFSGLPDSTGRKDIMSFTLTYAESEEALNRGELKKQKFWMYKTEAIPTGQCFIEAGKEFGGDIPSPIQ